MDTSAAEFDFIVVGAGSAGCAVAHQLAATRAGTIAVLEAGPADTAFQIRIPFGLIQLMGSKRHDWRFQSTLQTALHNRSLAIPRGHMLGGSSSINSMVWFRGCRADFDNWRVPGWSWEDVAPAFTEVENLVKPQALEHAHPLSHGFAQVFGENDGSPPDPEIESAGIFDVNIQRSQRWSAADAFLRPAASTGNVDIITGAQVIRIGFDQGKATHVELADGRKFKARAGVVLSAGSIMSPAILMRSGIGPAEHLDSIGIKLVEHSPGVGQNLQDHPTAAVHHAGLESGHGLTLRQMPKWLLAPFAYALFRKGPFASNIVEAGAFFRAADDSGPPDIQVHFLPYMLGWNGKQLVTGSGYLADVAVCRPHSRGQLRLASDDAHAAPEIDLGMLNDERDLDLLVVAFRRLRSLLQTAPFAHRQAPEMFPGTAVASDEHIREHIRAIAATAYHPVGTLAMGTSDSSPVEPSLKVRGTQNVWVADASIMPQVTTANTNAPCMMIGYRAGSMIAGQCKQPT